MPPHCAPASSSPRSRKAAVISTIGAICASVKVMAEVDPTITRLQRGVPRTSRLTAVSVVSVTVVSLGRVERSARQGARVGRLPCGDAVGGESGPRRLPQQTVAEWAKPIMRIFSQ